MKKILSGMPTIHKERSLLTKRIIGLFLALLLLACMPALAEEPLWSYDHGNMCLKLDGELGGDVKIPSEVDGYSVNAIEGGAFLQAARNHFSDDA